MDGDTSSCHRLSLINLSRILNNNLRSSRNGKLKTKAKAGFIQKNAYVNRSSDYETSVILNSDTYLGIESKSRDVNRRHLRKSSVDFKGLKNKLSSYKIAKSKIKEIPLKCNRHIYDGYKYEVTESRSRKCLSPSSFSELKCSKSNSSDLFGFRRCHRRRRNFDYNMSVIYKLLGRDCHDKNSQHDILKCKHYSIEDVSQNKKKSPLVNLECDAPTRYGLINFDQCNCSTDSKIMNTEKEKPPTTSNSCVDCMKNKSILKKVENVKSYCLLPPTKIVPEEGSCKSVSTQPINIKTKEKKLATVEFPSCKPCYVSKPVVNVCQHSKKTFPYPRRRPDEKKCNINDKSKKSLKMTFISLSLLKSAMKHCLSVIVVIVWLPCIIIVGFLWLVSYPFRPHHFSASADCKDVKKKRNFTQKNQNRKKKSGNMKTLHTHKSKCLPQVPLGLCAKNISSTMSLNSKNINEPRPVQSPSTTQNEICSQNKTGAYFFKPATTTIAFPCERRKANKERKRRKSVTFQQSPGKCNPPIPKPRYCPELYLKYKERAPCHKKKIPEKEQSTCQKKTKPKKCRQKKPKDVEVCVSKKLFNLLQTSLQPSCSNKKKTEVKLSCTSVQVPKCEKICKSKKVKPCKQKVTCNKKCDPICSKDFCLVSSQNKICPLDKNLMTCKPSTTKKCAQATCKSNAVIKFFPPPQKSEEKCFPPVGTAAISIDKVDSNMKTTSVIKFFPCPRNAMHTAGSCTAAKPSTEVKLSTEKDHGKVHQRTIPTNTVPLSSVVKFYPPPDEKPKKASSDGNVPKSSFFKSLRRKSKSKTTTTLPFKTTSVVKFIPKPKDFPADTLSEDLQQNLSQSPDEDTTSPKGAKASRQRTTLVKFFPAPPHKRRTLATNTKEYIDAKSRKPTSIIKFFPEPYHKQRTLGSTTDLVRNTKILKFFPAPPHRTRTLGSNTRDKPIKTDAEGRKVVTRSRKIDTKTPMHVIKFYPKTRTSTKTQGMITRVEKEKKPTESKPTSIVKFFPTPKHKTRSLTTNTSSKISYVYQTSSKKRKGEEEMEEETEIQKKKTGKRKGKKLKGGECKIRYVKKYYLEGSKTCAIADMKKKKDEEEEEKKRKKGDETAEKVPKIKRQSKKTMFKGSSEIIKFYSYPKGKLVDRGHKAREEKVERGGDVTVHTAIRPPRKIKSRRTQSRYQPALKPYLIDRRKLGKKGKLVKLGPLCKVGKIGMNYIGTFRKRQKKERGLKKFFSRMKNIRLIRMLFLDNVDCTNIRGGKKPYPWIEERWPKFYPAFLVFYNLYNNMIHIFFFFLAACVWCPLFCWCFFFYFFVLRKLVC